MSAQVAQIVASQSFLSQTSAIAATTLLTPPSGKVYRISAYITVTAGSGSVSGKLRWTDNAGAQFNGNNNALNAPSPSTPTLTIFATSAGPITVETSISGTVTYDLLVTVEEL